MKKFLSRITFFIFLSVSLHLVLYSLLIYFTCKTDQKRAIYVYGDSQTVQGLDINLLSDLTGLKVYSSSRHGSGIYDFLFFTEKVPENSKIILGISEHSQIRPNQYEANTSPLNIFTLKELYCLDYPISDLNSIIKKGLKPPFSPYFKSKNYLYSIEDTINKHTTIQSFIERYTTISEESLQKKQNMYLHGIKKLIEKNCTLTFIEFPYHHKLKKTVERTRFDYCFYNFKTRINKNFTEFTIDTLFLESNKNLMYDYTHLNELGAKTLTKSFYNRVFKDSNDTTKYILFDLRQIVLK